MTLSLFDQFPRTIVCTGATRIAAPADEVWKIVGNVGDTSLASDFIEKAELLGSGVGAVRHLHVKGGFIVSERVEEYNDVDRYYVYRVIDHGPLPFTHHLGTAKVTVAGPKECILSWITTAMAVDGHDADVKQMLQSNIDLSLAAVRKRFEHKQPVQ
jgi:mxaD protein